jgi:hypothetical protein
MTPAVAEAQVADRLRDVSTDYDRVPLVNMVAQALARQGHTDARHASRREAEQKVARRVAERLDEEAEQRLAEWEQRLAVKIGAPLRRLAVGPAPIELQTTSTRLIGRYRIAGDTQPGAHTPRPLAPADSLLSVQVHESAINNALDRLPLAGREVDLPTLFADVAAVFGAENLEVPDDLPQDIMVRFADEEPLRVDLIDGQARVTIRLAELETDRRRWRNIMSRAYYRPVVRRPLGPHGPRRPPGADRRPSSSPRSVGVASDLRQSLHRTPHAEPDPGASPRRPAVARDRSDPTGDP